MDGDHYLKIQAKYPYASVHEYLMKIPDAEILKVVENDLFDKIIAAVILFSMLIGLCAALVRLQIVSLWVERFKRTSKRCVSMKAPEEGGYHKSSELPVYVSR